MSYSALPSLAEYCNSNVILKKYILFVVQLFKWLFPFIFFFSLHLHFLFSIFTTQAHTSIAPSQAPAHLFHHLPLFIFPQESQTPLVLSLSLHSLSISLWYLMPLTRGVRCGRCSWWFSDLARFRGGFRSLCLCFGVGFGVYVSVGGIQGGFLCLWLGLEWL